LIGVVGVKRNVIELPFAAILHFEELEVLMVVILWIDGMVAGAIFSRTSRRFPSCCGVWIRK
jgi:hypothetical protein